MALVYNCTKMSCRPLGRDFRQPPHGLTSVAKYVNVFMRHLISADYTKEKALLQQSVIQDECYSFGVVRPSKLSEVVETFFFFNS